jgi:hypothetical protein
VAVCYADENKRWRGGQKTSVTPQAEGSVFKEGRPRSSVLTLRHAQEHDNSPPTEGQAAGQGWVSSQEGFPKKGTLPVHPPRRMSTPPLEGIIGIAAHDGLSVATRL